MIYLLVYFLLLLGGLISRRNASLRRAVYYLCLIGLMVFAAFRYQVGCDWTGYLNIFELSRNPAAAAKSEIAFWYVNLLLHYFELDYPYINVVAAFGFFIGLHALARRQPDPLSVLILAFPILILEVAMSGIRQAIAVGFLCFAYNAFVDRRLVGFVLLVVAASYFHSSALFFLLLAPLVRGEFSWRRVALGGVLAVPGVFYFLFTASFETYSHRYIAKSDVAFGAPLRTGLLALTGMAFLGFLDREWKAQSIRDYKLVKLSSYMMAATFPVSLYSSVAGDRFAFYLYPIQLVILARLPLLTPGLYSDAIALAPYAVGALFLLVWTQLSFLFKQCYIPYQLW